MNLSILTKSGAYWQLAIRTRTGGIEHWLLTDNEVERIRERSLKYPHLVAPVPAAGFFARLAAWLRG
jgi:hypothetical protein